MGIRKALALIFVSVLFSGNAWAHCAPEHVHVETSRTKAVFSVSLAKTPDEQAKGLMFVEAMPKFTGMLFIFPEMAPRYFWMKNTLIPLDIIYFDGDGHFVSMAEGAVPGDLTSLPSEGPAQLVLEINAGIGKQLGIGEGTVLRHASAGNAKDHNDCAN